MANNDRWERWEHFQKHGKFPANPAPISKAQNPEPEVEPEPEQPTLFDSPAQSDSGSNTHSGEAKAAAFQAKKFNRRKKRS